MSGRTPKRIPFASFELGHRCPLLMGRETQSGTPEVTGEPPGTAGVCLNREQVAAQPVPRNTSSCEAAIARHESPAT